MAENSEKGGEKRLPPKLSVRKKGVIAAKAPEGNRQESEKAQPADKAPPAAAPKHGISMPTEKPRLEAIRTDKAPKPKTPAQPEAGGKKALTDEPKPGGLDLSKIVPQEKKDAQPVPPPEPAVKAKPGGLPGAKPADDAAGPPAAKQPSVAPSQAEQAETPKSPVKPVASAKAPSGQPVSTPGDAVKAEASDQPSSDQPSPAPTQKPEEPAEEPAGDAPAAAKTEETGPSTVRIKAPAQAAKDGADQVAAPAPSGEKDSGADAAPKTVRIPRPQAKSGDTAKPVTLKPPQDKQADVSTARPQPGKTSPIPLDRLGGAPAKDAPKTIKLKRPVTSAAQPKAKPAEAGADEETVTAPAAGPSAEAAAEPESGGEAVTRKKTIKVKRPDRTQKAAKPLTIARPDQGKGKPAAGGHPAVASMRREPQADESAEEAPSEGGVLSIIAAVSGIAAVLVMGTLVYLFAAQAIPSLGLSWPSAL